MDVYLHDTYLHIPTAWMVAVGLLLVALGLAAWFLMRSRNG
jgi:LPXTG-motif cell wall-anchored protein